MASFEALTEEREMAARLRELYGDIDRLEWFVGLFAEGARRSPHASIGQRMGVHEG